MRWWLWAAKEAAYKAARRRDAATCFSPRRFEVTLGEALRGAVRFRGRLYALRIEAGADFAHAVASEKGVEALPTACGLGPVAAANGTRDPQAPGRAARALAISGISKRLGVAPAELSIARVARMPELRLRGAATPAILSLSHHGRYAAWAVVLNPPLEQGVLH